MEKKGSTESGYTVTAFFIPSLQTFNTDALLRRLKGNTMSRIDNQGKDSVEKAVHDILRKTCRQCSSEERTWTENSH